MFETFFTTKPAGKGTGLGLGISNNIITKYNGKIKVESIENKGTTFIISLPAQDASELDKGKENFLKSA